MAEGNHSALESPFVLAKFIGEFPFYMLLNY